MTNSLPTLVEIVERNPGWLDEAVDTHEAGRFSNTPTSTLETKRVRGGGPRFGKRGRTVFYTRRWLLEWLHATQRSSTSDTEPEAADAEEREPAPTSAGTRDLALASKAVETSTGVIDSDHKDPPGANTGL